MARRRPISSAARRPAKGGPLRGPGLRQGANWAKLGERWRARGGLPMGRRRREEARRGRRRDNRGRRPHKGRGRGEVKYGCLCERAGLEAGALPLPVSDSTFNFPMISFLFWSWRFLMIFSGFAAGMAWITGS